MKTLILILFFVPFFSFILSLFLPSKNEKLISRFALSTALINLFFTHIAFAMSAYNYFDPIFIKSTNILDSDGYHFFVALYLDSISLIFISLGSIVTFLITLYSRFYMHREKGYKRFFSTILFFYFGFNTVILAGNFESLMAGWEILGLSSFLLIGYYHDRFLPIKNSLKIYSIYRLGDIGLILAAWACHTIFHTNLSFDLLTNNQLIKSSLDHSGSISLFLAFALILTATVKSAQFPFFTWLPRAMEGPTPSSAIFYGSLSVHMGCYILFRTYNLWENLILARILIFSIGALTVFMCVNTARVQSTIKSQIAYSSLVQIGLIFIEIALGLLPLALFHLVANAFLRTYQLLISPSSVTYLIKEQFYEPKQNEYYKKNFNPFFLKKLYVNSVQEWSLDHLHDKYLWHPLKVGGRIFSNLSLTKYFALMTFISGLILILSFKNAMNESSTVLTLNLLGLTFGLRAFAEKNSALLAWNLIFLNHIWVGLSHRMLTDFSTDLIIYLSGIVPSWILGLTLLTYLKKHGDDLHIKTHQGLSLKSPKLSLLFFMACLGLSGFPISPTYIGEDLLFHHITGNQILMPFVLALTYVLDGIAIIRIYSRLFLGPNQDQNLDYALKSS
jgi:NADH-quinone oxidoreductase subunit L